MTFTDNTTPVVVLNCKLGGLGIMRSLGSLGVPLYGVDADPKSPAMSSKYCRKKFLQDVDERNPEQLVSYLEDIAEQVGHPAILIPTSDETSVLVAQYADRLKRFYRFPQNPPELIIDLMDKKKMYQMALEYNVPTPFTEFPQNIDDVHRYAEKAVFPIVLKGILGNRLQARTGKKMVIVNSKEQLIENYRLLEDPDYPNLMLQECIPGGDDEVYIFNGYFDENSNCLAPYTGHKVRQFPVHVGCASLGECAWNKEVATITTDFMKALGYKGILDIGYRLDPRDGRYKVLDINPRIGQAFRMFVSEDGMDVARDLYLNLTGQARFPVTPREGRRWMIEDFDIISSIDYYREGSLTFRQWLRSFKGLEEAMWFDGKDPMPFFKMSAGLIKQAGSSVLRRLGILKRPTARIALRKAPEV